MSALEKLQTWLSTCPHREGYPAKICVLPREMKEISHRGDVLGNTLVGYRYYVNLFWEKDGQGEDEKNATCLLDFQNWVREQSIMGLTPQFGDVPAGERVWTEKGGLTAGAQLVTYTVTLVAEFMKIYEAA